MFNNRSVSQERRQWMLVLLDKKIKLTLILDDINQGVTLYPDQVFYPLRVYYVQKVCVL